MCKESIQLEIIKKSEIKKKKAPARSLFYRNPDEKHLLLLFVFYLALYSGGLGHFRVPVCGFIRIRWFYGMVFLRSRNYKSQKNESGLRSRKNNLWRFEECATPYNRNL